MPKKIITYEKTARQRRQERLEAEQKANKKAEPVTEEVVTEEAKALAASRKKRVTAIVAALLAIVAVGMIVLSVLLMMDAKFPTDHPYAELTFEFGGKSYVVEYELEHPELNSSSTDTDKKRAKIVEQFVSNANAGVFDGTVFHTFINGCLEGGKYVKYDATSSSSVVKTSIVSNSRFKPRYYSISGPSAQQLMTSTQPLDDAYQLYALPYTSSDTTRPSGSTYRAGFGLIIDSTRSNRSEIKGARIGIATAKGKKAIDSLKAAFAVEYPEHELKDFAPITLKSVRINGNLFEKWGSFDYLEAYSDYTYLGSRD